jgi:hypothetical protein
MKLAPLLAILSLPAIQTPPPAVDTAIERLATCQDSWRDWKENPAESKRVGELFTSAFVQAGNDGSFTPRSKVSVVGLPVKRVYPQSVGMGVGFSVILDATFADTQAHAEAALGKKLGKCETGEGMHTCELEIAKERTITLLAGEHDERHEALLGCYYLYEK